MQLVSALSSELAPGVPHEIVYLPEGEHSIFPTVNGKPKQVTVRVPREQGPAIAAALDAKLQQLRQDGVRPFLDINHQHGEASALPLSFHYEDGRGVILAVDWTSAGRAAVEGRNWSYFSPEFLMNDDGTPGGLPERGALGGLVNKPAFRTASMQIAASDAGAGSGIESRARELVAAGQCRTFDEALDRVAASEPELYNEYLGTLGTSASAPSSHVAASAPAIGSDHPLITRAETLVDLGECLNLDDALARVAASDPSLYDSYLDHIAAGSAVAPVRVVGAATTTTCTFVEKARALVAAGQASSLDDALSLVAAQEPSLYTQYLSTLS